MARSISALLLLIVSTPIFAGDTPTSLKRQVATRRKSVTAVEAIVKTKLNYPRLNAPTSWESHVWIDGKYAREDRIFTEDAVQFRQVKSVTPTELIYWKSDRILNVEGMAIHRWRGERLEEERQRLRLGFPSDPRLFGLSLGITNSLTVATPLDSIFPNSTTKRTATVVQTKEVGDRELNEVLTTLPEGGEIRMLFDPSAENILVAITYTFEISRESIKTEYQQWGEETKVWFPRHVVAEQFSGDKLVYHEETHVKLISVNSPIPHSRFSIESLDIPPKQFQTYPTASPSYWDGTQEQPGYRPASLK